MINKEELLESLKEYLEFEEDIVSKLANYYLALGWKSSVTAKSAVFIEKEFGVLKEDSIKHVAKVSEMIKYIEGEQKMSSNVYKRKFEDLLDIEKKAMYYYKFLIGKTEDKFILKELHEIYDDEVKHADLAQKFVECFK